MSEQDGMQPDLASADAHQALERLDALQQAFADPDIVADRCLNAGQAVVRYLGVDCPRELFLAAGVIPIRLASGESAVDSSREDLATLGSRGRALLARLEANRPREGFAITHADQELAQLFANLREIGPPRPFERAWIEMIDRLHLPQVSSHTYNHARFQQLAERIHAFGGARIDSDALRAAIQESNEQKRWLARLNEARYAGRLTGTQLLSAIGAAHVLPPQEHIALLRDLVRHAVALPQRHGVRVYLCGSGHDGAALYDLIEGFGALVVGEDHDNGERWCEQELDELSDPWHALAQPMRWPPLPVRSTQSLAAALMRAFEACWAEVVIHVVRRGDEAAAWEAAHSRQVCARAGVPWLRLDFDPDEPLRACEPVERFLQERPMPRAMVERSSVPVAASSARAERKPGERSRKALESIADFGRYQREWFAQVRERAAKGETFAVVNANAPQEILRAFDVPFVVNQWWASIVAAKQQSDRYAALLQAQGYPADVEAYSAQGLAACFDGDETQAPWGGLPRPSLLVAVTSSDATLKIFEAWAQASGAQLHLFERSVDCRRELAANWWDELPEHWDRFIEPERLDLMEAELRDHIARLERQLRRPFSNVRFREVMDWVNEQEEWYRRTRDLIASCEFAPVSIADTMPATMVPQWHRGTPWGRDAARAFYEEVASLVERGQRVCPNERIRLMWVGRGMWSEMGFYQKWERSHGAVFVWSMYLALAADGYIRKCHDGCDPIRALAARFVTMGDELRMPTWGGAWHVHEAMTHRVDGAVALSDADPFVVRALRQAGIPVLTLDLDNFSKDAAASDAAERSIVAFIEGPALARAQQRVRASY